MNLSCFLYTLFDSLSFSHSFFIRDLSCKRSAACSFNSFSSFWMWELKSNSFFAEFWGIPSKASKRSNCFTSVLCCYYYNKHSVCCKIVLCIKLTNNKSICIAISCEFFLSVRRSACVRLRTLESCWMFSSAFSSFNSSVILSFSSKRKLHFGKIK